MTEASKGISYKGKQLIKSEECAELSNEKVHELYGQYVNKSQAELLKSFGFGRENARTAEGIYIYTDQHKKIMDMTGGFGVLGLGHNHPRLLKARIRYQEEKRMEFHRLYLCQYLAALGHNIAQILPDPLNKSYFCNSGAEAVEGSLKLAYKYHNGKRKHVIASQMAFHGKLLGSGGLTSKVMNFFDFPTIPGIEKFEFNNIESVKELINRLRNEKGESDIYAMLVEPFSGSSFMQSTPEFLKEVRELCSKENIVLIFDEVYSGWAKTTDFFAFMRHDVVPDIVTMSKTFGGGKSSISGFTTSTKLFAETYENMNDAMLHSTTYNGFGEECITALEAINVMVEDDYVERSKQIHKKMRGRMKALQEKYPEWITELRGDGTVQAIVFNCELNTLIKTAIKFVPIGMLKDPLFMNKLVMSSIMSELYSNHNILVYFDTHPSTPLVLSTTNVITDDEIDHLFDCIDKTLSVGKHKLVVKFAKSKFTG